MGSRDPGTSAIPIPNFCDKKPAIGLAGSSGRYQRASTPQGTPRLLLLLVDANPHDHIILHELIFHLQRDHDGISPMVCQLFSKG
jgi:hypothetical protein